MLESHPTIAAETSQERFQTEYADQFKPMKERKRPPLATVMTAKVKGLMDQIA